MHPGFSGVFASTPLVVGGRVYLQDLDSNVYALDLATGRLLWRHRFGDPDGGPNGLGVTDGRSSATPTAPRSRSTRRRARSSGSGSSPTRRRET